MHEHHLSITKTVRYYTIGKASAQTRHIWFCLHGYGQLADFFAKHFEKWADKSRLFVFPEAPSRFYTQGTSGRVGASWMTKVDREQDIADQFLYLEKLLQSIVESAPQNTKLHILGFSQGVATALRWLNKTAHPISTAICWAGTFPPDIDYAPSQAHFNKIKLFACFGDADEFISQKQASMLVDAIKNQGLNITEYYYHGGHRLMPELLENLIFQAEKG